MNTSDRLTSQPQVDLVRRIAELERQLQQRDELIAALREEVRQLREQLDEANRRGKRQATPFARAKRVERPKRPGRKKG